MAGVLKDDFEPKRKYTSPTITVYFMTFVAQLSVFNDGFEVGSTSAVILLVQNIDYMRLTSFWKELIVAGSMPGAGVSCLIGAWFCDKFGRKKCIMCSSFCFILGAIVTASAYGREVLLLGRLLTGCGMGFGASSSALYVAECSPSHLRGCLVGSSQILFTVGILTATVISVVFSHDKSSGWRYIWGFQGVFGCFQLIGLLFLPESPRWLIKKSRKKEAKQSLIRIRNSETVEEEIWEIENIFKAAPSSIKNSGAGNLLLMMLKSRSVRRALMVGCGIQLFAEFSGVNTIIYYSGIIIQMSGVGDMTTVIWNTVIINFINLTFAIVGVWLVDRVGRRTLAIIGLLGLSVSSCCLGTIFLMATKYSPWINTTDGPLNSTCSLYSYCDDCIRDPLCGFCYENKPDVNNGACLPVSDVSYLISKAGACNSTLTLSRYSMKWAYEYCPVPYSWVAIVGLALFLMFCAPAVGPIPWTINAEIYPLWARSIGNGIGSMTCLMSNLIVSVTFLSVIEAIHNYGVFYVMASVAVVGSAFCFFFLPETKNKSLEEIELLFMSRN